MILRGILWILIILPILRKGTDGVMIVGLSLFIFMVLYQI